ncbi:MAG: phage holin family protein [Acidobacteriota bacterium]|nr:phage holin family protein [Acidobacteriota bacterium]
MGRIKQRVQSLGQSVVEVVRAEVHSLLDDFQHTGRGLTMVLALATAALILIFWAAGVGTAALVALIAVRLPVWAAAGIVFLVLMLSAGILLGWGWMKMKKLETPTQTVRRHVDDHLGWWRGQLVEEEGTRSRRRRSAMGGGSTAAGSTATDSKDSREEEL